MLTEPHLLYDHGLGVYHLMVALDGHYFAAIVDTASKYTVMARRVYDASAIEAPLQERTPQFGHGALGGTLALTHGFAATMSVGEAPNLFTCTLHLRVTDPDAHVGFDFVLGNDFLRTYALYAPVAKTIALKQLAPAESTSPPTKRRLFG